MKNLEFDHLIRELKRSSAPIVIFGTKKVGSLTYHALKNAGIKVDYFCDDAEEALNKKSIFDRLLDMFKRNGSKKDQN